MGRLPEAPMVVEVVGSLVVRSVERQAEFECVVEDLVGHNVRLDPRIQRTHSARVMIDLTVGYYVGSVLDVPVST